MAQGLWQQTLTLSNDQTDCNYRVELMRERLLALMDQSPSPRWLGADPTKANLEAHDDFANLLRETHAACDDASPELAQKLERIEAIHARERDRREDAAAARAELIALESSSR